MDRDERFFFPMSWFRNLMFSNDSQTSLPYTTS